MSPPRAQPRCQRCKLRKPRAEFGPPDRPDVGVSTVCLACRAKTAIGRQIAETYTCRKCRKRKSADQFGEPRRRRRFRDEYCTPCRQEIDSRPPRHGSADGALWCRRCNAASDVRRTKQGWLCRNCQPIVRREERERAAARNGKLYVPGGLKRRWALRPVTDAEWSLLEKQNAKQAWEWWLEAKAPPAWLKARRAFITRKKKQKWREARYQRLRWLHATPERVNIKGFGRLYADHKRCQYCDVILTRMVNRHSTAPTDATVDHIIALSNGGAHSLSNIAIVCRSCNTSKNSQNLDVWAKMQDENTRNRALLLYKSRFLGKTPPQTG